MALAAYCWVLLQAASTPAGEPRGAAATPGDVTIQAIQRGTAYLLQSQNKDGSWGGPQNAAHEFWSNPETHRSWQVGTTGLCCMTLMDQWQSGGSPEPEIAAAVKRALDYLSGNTDLKRPSDWDTDNTWGYIYGLQATSRASAFPKLAKAPERDSWRLAAEQFAKQLKRYQSPNGGWGYYADDTAGWRSEWATSFMTAVSVLAHLEAKKAGIPFDPEVLAKAVKAVERCKLPNGAYSYDVMATPRTFSSETINDVKGSLGRIQVCNLALRRAGVAISDADLRTGLDEFFEYHKFLDVARMKPIPHEAYYQNAGYFYFFGHYYAAGVIEELPKKDRAPYAEKLRREVVKCQEKDGSMWDFYLSSFHRPWGTSFGVMALASTLAATRG